MSTTSKQWEVRFLIGLKGDSGVDESNSVEFAHLFGETIEALRQEVGSYLRKYQLDYFETFGDHITAGKCYLFSDGNIDPPSDWTINPEYFRRDKGWWVFSKKLVSGEEKQDEEHSYPSYLGDLERTVEHFIETAFIPQKGPDYRSRAIVENQLQLPLLEAVIREVEDDLLNDLLRRGWHMIALEYQGEVSRIGELTNRKAFFIFGHADFPAALVTLEARDHYYRFRYSNPQVISY